MLKSALSDRVRCSPAPARTLVGIGKAAAVFLLILPSLAAAPTSRPAAADPIQVVLQFVEAFESADAAALRQLIYVEANSAAQASGRDALIDIIAARRKLELAAADRFPGQSRRLARGVDLKLWSADRGTIASATFSRDESQTTRVSLPNGSVPIRLRRSLTGEWQILIEIIESDLGDSAVSQTPAPDRVSRLRIDRLRATAGAFDAAASRIASGDYADILVAEADLVDRLAAVRADYRRKADELFSRRQQTSSRTNAPD